MYEFSSTFINTMPIWGNTGVLGQSDRGKTNRSRPTYYDIDMDILYNNNNNNNNNIFSINTSI